MSGFDEEFDKAVDFILKGMSIEQNTNFLHNVANSNFTSFINYLVNFMFNESKAEFKRQFAGAYLKNLILSDYYHHVPKYWYDL